MRQFLVMAALCSTCGLQAAETSCWHERLYLGNGGYWRQRIPVEIRNDAQRPAEGDPVEVEIGSGPGQAALEGARIEALRVCDAKGTEMLYGLASPGGQWLRKGPIPAGSRLVLPVECPARSTVSYYVYFDNPAAWRVPDFLERFVGLRNGSLEEGTGEVLAGWHHDAPDAQHRAFWVAEHPHSGKRCLKTVVADGAEHTWIATRQAGIRIEGGAPYVMRAWVKAENVKGYAGWYIHVGTPENPMMIAPMLDGGGGTYGWKQVTQEFTAPADATVADLGTVLRGTGTAWFDDVQLECKSPPRLRATAGTPEALPARPMPATAAARGDTTGGRRVPVTVVNTSDRPLSASLIQADLSAVAPNFPRKPDESVLHVTDGTKPIAHYVVQDSLLIEGDVPARTVNTYWVSASKDSRAKSDAGAGFAGLLTGKRNLVRNPNFENGETLPEGWSGGSPGERPAGVTMGLDGSGLFGKQCAKLHVPPETQLTWVGWRQDVPVHPGRTYLFAAWLKCQDIADGSVQLHVHHRNAAGELCKDKGFDGAGPPSTGTKGWTLISGLFGTPADAAIFQIHLTMMAHGTVWHDGAVVVEVTPGMTGIPETVGNAAAAGLAVWPVNAVVKVFQSDPVPAQILPARISAARNEYEPLQFAIRSGRAFGSVEVQVDPSSNAQGARLPEPEIGVVGYIPIDHKTSYYHSTSPVWHRKYPESAGQCDGWPGMWPDPILPKATFDLAADTTQPIWITVRVPKDAAPGDYHGRVVLRQNSETLKEIPFTVHVWGFTLPDENHVAAIYDLRLGGQWDLPGKSQREIREQFLRFMAERRVCPDTIHPAPEIRYQDGKVVADFTEFDQAATFYFDRLKLARTYTPWYFYLFGWGHPPADKFGQQPYEGKHPYEGVDRSKLRPEYKKAYQACLRAYWDHMKAKGWADKCVLYISDEPFYTLDPIKTQMKALCDMIHEVDPAIPIYCSTWSHHPEWNGYLDVWGIGHYGIVPPETMKKLQAAGDRIWFTTDGQMCTDTPCCGVERLLPHYCFQYGAEAYEFWGISWLTYDPYEFGWHQYIHQSETPGKSYYIRYPNGDGFLAYPGGPIGHDGPVTSVRLEQAREGVEDYEYLYLLRGLAAKAKAAGKDCGPADRALELAGKLVSIPNAGGRFSTKILPNPDTVFEMKEALAGAIEALSISQ